VQRVDVALLLGGRQLALPGEAPQVAAAAEVIALPAQHDGAHRAKSGGGAYRLGGRPVDRGIDRVARLGIAQREDEHRTLAMHLETRAGAAGEARAGDGRNAGRHEARPEDGPQREIRRLCLSMLPPCSEL